LDQKLQDANVRPTFINLLLLLTYVYIQKDIIDITLCKRKNYEYLIVDPIMYIAKLIPNFIKLPPLFTYIGRIDRA